MAYLGTGCGSLGSDPLAFWNDRKQGLGFWKWKKYC